MKGEKAFDCVVEMKTEIQERLLREIGELGEEEARKRRTFVQSRDSSARRPAIGSSEPETHPQPAALATAPTAPTLLFARNPVAATLDYQPRHIDVLITLYVSLGQPTSSHWSGRINFRGHR
jgi:hypothetical protein